MDTIAQLPAKYIDDLDALQPIILPADELNTIKNFLSLTRDMQETKQLFDVFHFNLKCLRNAFTLHANDTVMKSSNCPEYNSENIAVNALVINLISSAKTLAETLRATAIRWFEKSENGKDKFNLYVSSIYDSSKVYRILMHLRDYAQHGYLPVSFKEDKYSFDLYQILTTPHFNMNSKIKSDIEDFLSIFDKSKEVGCLALTITIADFVVRVIDIYRVFLCHIKEKISSSYLTIQEMIKSNPCIICDTPQCFKGSIVYWDEDNCHAFDPEANPNITIKKYEEYVSTIFEHEKNELVILHPSFANLYKKGAELDESI